MNCKALIFLLACASMAQATSADKDAFGIKKLYPSDPAKSSHDWLNNWSGSQRTLERAGQADPYDSQTVMKGRGYGITIGSDECIFLPGIPRLFINQEGSDGYENVEFTAYANWMKGGEETTNAGFTMIGRSDHFFFKDDGCNAAGYLVRIWEGSNKEGQVSFQKEYYHGDSSTVYSRGVYEDLFNGFPKNQWIGMKFVIFTVPGTDNVQLEFYIDRTDGQNGGDWTLEHAYIDKPGGWNAKESVPSSCPVQSGDTILGEAYSFALRTDGGEVHWKRASIRHILPGPAAPGPSPTPPTPTAVPPTPTAVPPTPTTPTSSDWTVITFDDFEAGLGNFVLGGNDAHLYTGGTWAHQGSNAIEIRDDRDGSVITHGSEHDIAAFNELRVSFWFIADDMDDDEDFWLQYSTDGGTQWITKEVWTHAVDFQNNRFYQEEVFIDSSGMNAIKLRFRCDASNNNDSVYIDEIKFEGKA